MYYGSPGHRVFFCSKWTVFTLLMLTSPLRLVASEDTISACWFIFKFFIFMICYRVEGRCVQDWAYTAHAVPGEPPAGPRHHCSDSGGLCPTPSTTTQSLIGPATFLSQSLIGPDYVVISGHRSGPVEVQTDPQAQQNVRSHDQGGLQARIIPITIRRIEGGSFKHGVFTIAL